MFAIDVLQYETACLKIFGGIIVTLGVITIIALLALVIIGCLQSIGNTIGRLLERRRQRHLTNQLTEIRKTIGRKAGDNADAWELYYIARELEELARRTENQAIRNGTLRRVA